MYTLKRKGGISGGDEALRYRYRKVNMTHAAQRIFEIIDDLGMTDYEFCVRYGFNRSTLNGWRNSNIDPGLEMIQRFCNAIGITMDEFYHEGVFSAAEEEIKIKKRELLTMRILSREIVEERRTPQIISYMRYVAFEEKKV